MSPCAIARGSEVAILPTEHSGPSEVLEIATVKCVSSVFVQLADGRMYTTIGGRCIGGKYIGSKPNGYIVPATDEHRAALHHHPVPAA